MSRKPQPFRRNTPNVPIIGQRRQLPKFESPIDAANRVVPEPQLGYMVIKLIPVEKTTSGIILPDQTENNGESTAMFPLCEVVKTSGRYFVEGGTIMESDVKVGDRVIIGPGAPHATYWAMPDDLRVVRLIDVWGILPPIKLPEPHPIALGEA